MSGEPVKDYRELTVRRFVDWLRRNAPYMQVPGRMVKSRRMESLLQAYFSMNQLEAGRPTAAAYIAKAKLKYEDEGRIEIDASAVVSQARRSEDCGTHGAYVMAWVYVHDTDAPRGARIKKEKK